jgi:two-component system, response regulator YesN
LIKQLSDRERAPAMLILSGYDDFQYAIEAIKHQVKDYLLKPIVREELFGALSKIEAELGRQASILHLLDATDRYREGLRVRTLEAILADAGLPSEVVEEKCKEAGLQQFEPSYYVAVVNAFDQRRAWMKGKEFVSRADKPYVCLENKDGMLILLTSEPDLIEGLTNELSASFAGEGAYAVGISEEGTAIAQLPAKMEEALHALKYRLLLGHPEAAVIRYEQIKQRNRAYPIPADAIHKLANMMGTDRDKEMQALLLSLFEPNTLRDADIRYFEDVSLALNAQVFDRAFHAYGEASVEIIRKYRKAGNLSNFTSIQQYIHCAQSLMSDLNDYIRHLKSVHADSKEMYRALDYIHAHFDKDLSMAVVSNHVSLHYSYFSERFKEHTGESFLNYLKKIRIQKAKELLERSDERVYEIGKLVGFVSPKHFNRVFRELEGISPMEFRQKTETAAARHE